LNSNAASLADDSTTSAAAAEIDETMAASTPP
jgi:hypothetical protein